jgi:hypothetical protein
METLLFIYILFGLGFGYAAGENMNDTLLEKLGVGIVGAIFWPLIIGYHLGLRILHNDYEDK